MEGELMKDREMVVDLVHQSWGAYKQLGIAPKFSLTPGSLSSHAPELGEHTRPILEQLGYSPARIEELKSSGLI
jgi:crotonobetainyl-CoA:carnitine CoA-transferase CaiB-like acyl-CoA transferase